MRERSWTDHSHGYGRISRAFHWTMAALIVWQLVTVVLRVAADDTPLSDFFWSTHFSVGFTIWWMAILRGIWGLSQLSQRPAHEGPRLLRKGATVGHVLIYLLLIVVPTLALLRAIGGENGLVVYGVQLVAGSAPPNDALRAPANAAHGRLGFILFVLTFGHVAFALWHGLVRRDGTLRRMTRGHA